MNIFKYIIPAILTLTGFSTAFAQQTRILTADKHNEYGLVYTLPNTALRVTVTARRTVNQAGPFYQYAKKYVGADNVIKQDSQSWEIIDVKVTPYGVPDTENQYLMQLKQGAPTYISVDENGMLLAINKEVLPPAAEPKSVDKIVPLSNMREYLDYVNEDFIASQSSAKKAQMLAETLMEIRDSKLSLTRGTADAMPTDGRQLELMLQSLGRQESAITAAFTGVTTVSEITRTFTFMPTDAGEKVLFRMSDFAGFVDADDYSGDPVKISVALTREPSMPVDAKGEEKKLPKDAVIYNIPGAARVTLSLKGSKLWSDELDFAQFGTTFGLNPQLFSAKKERSYARFNPVTGALIIVGEVNAAE